MSDEVTIALIGAVATVAAAGFGALGVWITRSLRDTKRAIGEPNGHGSLVAMAQQLLAGQAGQDRRLAQLEVRAARTEEQVTGIDGRLAVLERQGEQQVEELGRIERRD